MVLTEEFDWLGGQLTSQAVPPDEHTWVERFGVTASYRELRDRIRDYYRRNYPLTDAARRQVELNPGPGTSAGCAMSRGWRCRSSRRCWPRTWLGRLTLLQPYRPTAAQTDGDRVLAVTVTHRDTGEAIDISADYVLDATETGDLLPLTGTEYVTGFESRLETGEPSGPEDAQPGNMQAVSVCFAVDEVPGNVVIDKPEGYDFWRS